MALFDFAQAATDLAAVVAENATSISIRRGSTTLEAQSVRIARAGNAHGRQLSSGEMRESRGRVVVVGGKDLDIRPDDRFNAGDELYRVVLVRPNRLAAVIAEAEVVE
jgi:hypothetical protein